MRSLLKYTVVAGALAFVCMCHNSVLAQDKLLQRFLVNAPVAWEEYNNGVRFLQGAVTIEAWRGPADALKRKTTFMITEKCNETGKAEIRQTISFPGGNVSWEARVNNDRYGFQLSKAGEESPWRFVDGMVMAKPSEATDPYLINFAKSPFRPALTQLRGVSLIEFVRSDRFHPVSANEEALDGTSTVRVDFEVSPSAENDINQVTLAQMTKGTFWCDPNRYWIPLKISFTELHSTSKAEVTQTVRLDKTEGLPVPKEIVIHQASEFLAKSEPIDAIESRVAYDLEIPASLPAESEFTLTAFGLPELDWLAEQEAPRASSTWVWFTLIGGALLLIGIGAFSYTRSKWAA